MPFFLTLIYIVVSLLSPGVLPEAVSRWHVSQILGGLTILSLLPSIPGAALLDIPEAYLLFFMTVATLFSGIAAGWLGGILPVFAQFIPNFIVFYFIVISCTSLKRLRILVVGMSAVAFFDLGHGLQAYLSGNFINPYLMLEGTSLVRFRGLGFLADPNDFAQLLVTLVGMQWLRWRPGKLARNFALTIVPAALLAAGVFLTHSRGGAIALLMVILFGFKDKLGAVKSAVLTGMALSLLLALNVSGGRGMDNDDGGRLAFWGTGLQVFKAHPLFGVGMGNFGNYNDTGYTAHNSYVLCLSELGATGFFCWMGLLVFSWSGLTAVISSGGEKHEPESGDAPAPPSAAFPLLGRLAAADAPIAIPADSVSLMAPFREVPIELGSSPQPPPGASFEAAQMEREQTGEPEDERLPWSATVMRFALAGLLASAFFISRTYVMTLYIFLGMAVALRRIYERRHPEGGRLLDPRRMVKRTCVIMAASVLFLYVFVRMHGVV